MQELDLVRYRDYVRLLSRVLEHLSRYYSVAETEAQTREEESMSLYAHKFLATVRALRYKYMYTPEYLARPGVDLTESGFPTYYDISKLDADLATRDERLPKLPSMDELKQALIEHLFSVAPDGEEEVYRRAEISLLWQISERYFLESLDLRKQFFPFTPGKLALMLPEEVPSGFITPGRRMYTFSWGCYDPQANRPSVYFMLFEQEETERPLDEPNNPEYVKFLGSVQHHAARAPENLSVIGIRLDEGFATLYPKSLKRITLSTLYAPMLHKQLGADVENGLSMHLGPLFKKARLADNDFVLFFSTEIVYSEREVDAPKSLLSFGKGKVRQIFYVPKTDRELVRRGSSMVHEYALMPHRLRQHIDDAVVAAVSELQGTEFIVYTTNEGDIINVG